MRLGFPGFPPEAVAFYRGLARHNTREWFQPRKHIYDEKVKAPMVQLVTELNRALMDFASGYVTDAPKAIYRIYRDTRFSPDKTPYKTQIAASFARRGMEKHGAAGFYFAVSHKGVDVGGGIYMPASETLLTVRTHIAERHRSFGSWRLPARSSGCSARCRVNSFRACPRVFAQIIPRRTCCASNSSCSSQRWMRPSSPRRSCSLNWRSASGPWPLFWSF